MMPPFPSSPIMPQGGFSPLRLEGWRIRRDLPETSEQLKPAPGIHWPTFGLSSPFVLQR